MKTPSLVFTYQAVEVEVPAKLVTELTGYAGALSVSNRGSFYRIEVEATGKLKATQRNGEPSSMADWPPNVVKKLARAAANFLSVGLRT